MKITEPPLQLMPFLTFLNVRHSYHILDNPNILLGQLGHPNTPI